jgi:hypothetical protein
MQYSLELLGRRFRLSVPFELHIGPSMMPFIRPAQGEGGQFHILVRPGKMPLPDQECIWDGSCYYAYQPSYLRVLRCQTRSSAPYAMVEMREDGNIRVTYRPEYVHFLKNASDLMHLIGLEQLLLHHGGLILHSSLIAKNNRAILFSAPSGTGKSTQAKLWQTHRGYEILNGDRAGICKTNGVWKAWGLPYAGTSGIYRNESADIAAIVILRQGSENCISKPGNAKAVRFLYPEVTVHQWAEEFVATVLDHVEALVSEVPVYLFECLPNEDAVCLLEQTLQGEGVL